MANQAKVTSLDALELFRSNMIVFRTKAKRSLDMSIDEVRRMQTWLQNDRRTHWESEIRRRRKTMEQAEADLYSSRLAGAQESSAVKRAAVNKAKRALEEAEEKLKNVKRWVQKYGTMADQLIKRLEPLRQIVEQDMPDGIAFLAQVQNTLQAYTDVALTPDAPATAAASAPETTEPPSAS